MGAFDDVESHSPNRHGSMLSRGFGEARRRIVLLALLGFFLLLSLVAFRRQDKFQDMVGSRTQKAAYNHTTSLPKSGPKSDSKSDAGSKTRLKPEAPKTKGPILGNGERSLAETSLADIHNTSLGFEKIFVLNVPSRSDKLDAIKLTASLTNFDFDIIPGINGKDVPKKALSGQWDESTGLGGIIGCWRGHVEFAGHVARNRLSTALVMEDDADWDVNLRSQLEYVALGSQTLLNNPKDRTPHSPYGDGWDLIWLGHCASQPVDGDRRRFIMKNDPNVTPFTRRTNYGNIPDMTPYDNNTRIMYFTKGSTCTYSYALSLHGARKVLKYLSMDIYNKPVDFGLHDMCEKKERGFKCIGIFPQIIADHKPAGAGNKDTDIGDGGENIREKGFSYNIVRSTRLNAEALMDGRPDLITSQWPDESPDLKGPIITEYTENAQEQDVSS